MLFQPLANIIVSNQVIASMQSLFSLIPGASLKEKGQRDPGNNVSGIHSSQKGNFQYGKHMEKLQEHLSSKANRNPQGSRVIM